MNLPELQYLTSLPLKHHADCSLLGVSSDLTVYVEEVYSDEAWLAQHALNMNGTILQSVDEDAGHNEDAKPLPLPNDLVRPHTAWQTMHLNFAGARHRGLREPERLLEVARSISIQDKLRLAPFLPEAVTPPRLLGIVDSYVLAEAAIDAPHTFLVCRRLRFAYALEKERLDGENQPYDYDTFVFYAAHFYNRHESDTFNLNDILTGFAPPQLHRPMDCLIRDNYLFIADGGDKDRVSAIQVWQITPLEKEEDSPDKKIYG